MKNQNQPWVKKLNRTYLKTLFPTSSNPASLAPTTQFTTVANAKQSFVQTMRRALTKDFVQTVSRQVWKYSKSLLLLTKLVSPTRDEVLNLSAKAGQTP